MNFRKLVSLLAPVDFISILFLLFLDALNLAFFSRVAAWRELVLINTAVIAAIIALAYFAEQKGTRLLIGLHRWYCYPIILFVFKEIYLMVHPINPTDYDAWLIAADRWMFGVDPTQWLARFAHPVLTEILQISYFSYYLLFIVMGVEVYRRYAVEEFDRAAFMIVYGFYLSYLGYFLLPGVGPRFTLHDFHSLGIELPGILLTNTLRGIINAGESISTNLPNPQDFVQRDIFPSGHTQLSLIVVFLGFRYNLSSRWFLATLASLLIIGTVYLRYHYVIDIVGGILFFLLTIGTSDAIEAWWGQVKGRVGRKGGKK
ncbi:MAG: phosphatase PAP2 family protein [Bacteroidota bacterium]